MLSSTAIIGALMPGTFRITSRTEMTRRESRLLIELGPRYPRRPKAGPQNNIGAIQLHSVGQCYNPIFIQ